MRFLFFTVLSFIISCQMEEELPLRLSTGYYCSTTSQERIFAPDKRIAEFEIFNDSKGVLEYGAGSFIVRKIINNPLISKNELYKFEFFVVSNHVHIKESIEMSNWYFNPSKKEIYKVPKNLPFRIIIFKNEEPLFNCDK